MTNAESKPIDHEPTDSAVQEEPDWEEAGSRLTRRQTLALPIIAAAPNLTQAARDAGISDATLRRWRREPHFRAELDRMTHEIAETTREGLKELILQGIQVIGDLMEDPDPMVRFRAARAAVILGIQVCKAEEYRRQGEPGPEAAHPE